MNNASQHKSKETFPYSTIIEALCEFHFTPASTGDEWEGKWFGRLLTELGKEYDMEPKIISGIQVQTAIDGQTVSSQPVATGHMIYQHRSGSHLIQLTPWKLTVNEIGKYTSWEAFFDHLHHAWNALEKVIPSSQVKRIGMRYINKIPRKSPEDTVGTWIHNPDLIPKNILEQKINFAYRCELQKNELVKLILNITEDKTGSPHPLFFDIDVIAIKDFISSWERLSIELSDIHSFIRSIFDETRTERYTHFLRSGV